MAAPYAELHVHSCFSLLDAPCQPAALAQRAAELGYEHLALTDHQGLYGVVRFARACAAAGLHPVIGAEVTLDDGSHLTLLAETDAGYATLARLLSAAHLGWESPRRPVERPEAEALTGDTAMRRAVYIPWAWLLEQHEGLLVLTGCRQGPLARALAAGRRAEALALARRLRQVFGSECCFVELQDHGLPGDRRRCAELAALADAVGLPLVATNNVHYLDAESWRLQDVLVCIREQCTLDTPHPARKRSSAYVLRPPAAMARRFARYPQAVANTLRLAERCQVTLDFRAVRFPPLPHLVPPGETADQTLRRLAYEGAQRRYGELSEPVVRQLEHELGVIARLGVAPFFLICADLANRFRGRGRGSAADSLVAYCLGITQVDPLRHRLLFERFLNEERPSMPDIDIDFGLEDRERAIAYVYQTYGAEHAAMVCNYVTFQARSAVRDLGRVLGLPAELVAELAASQGRLGEELSAAARRLAAGLGAEGRRRLSWLVRLVPQLQDLPRHRSIHVGGMVITGRPLVELVPLEPARMPGRVVVGWDKRDVEDAGLIKTDLLCIRALSLVHRAVELVERHSGVRLELEALPLDDPAVYRQLQAADTIGAYQVESRAQQQSLPKSVPTCFDDLIAQVAIIRPGPIQGGMVHPYLRRRQGREPVRYLHPKLEPILRDTLGVILYQEQVLEVAMAIAGMTAGEADAFRRAMGSRRSRAAMEALRAGFLAGAARQGVPRATAERIFAQMAAFAEFGFCKSHAAALAQTAYETLWLRAYYPAAFYCALLDYQPMGFYPPEVVLWDAVRHGVGFLPPDVTRSAAGYTLEGDAVRGPIRLGLRQVKGVGEATAARIVAARAAAPFRTPEEVVRRARLGPEAVRALVLVGAFAALAPEAERRQLLWRLLPLATAGGERAAPAEQVELALGDEEPVALPPLEAGEQTLIDYALLGLCLDRQLLALYARQRQLLKVTPAGELGQRPHRARVRVAGLVVCRQAPPTAKGVLFLTLEDESGLANVVVRPAVRAQFRAVLRAPVLLVDGWVQREGALVSVVAEEVRTLGRPSTVDVPATALPRCLR
jgi:error-prone DNA polymerase